MASQTSGSTPTHPKKNAPGSTLKRWLIRVAILLVLAALGAVGWRQFKEFRKARMVERAREFIEKKQYDQAMLSVRRALQLNPRDIAANRIILELTEASGSKEALYRHGVISMLEPDVLENHIGVVDCALRFNEPVVAEHALERVNEAGKKKASFHDAAGRVAQALKRVPEAQQHFEEAVKLEPAKEEYQLHAAAIHMQSDDAAIRAGGREGVERFLTHPKLGRIASRALFDDLLRNKEWEKALALGKQFQGAPDATMGERMRYLALLRQLQHPDFAGYLLTLQEDSVKDADRVATLITWLTENSLVDLAVEWSRGLPADIASKMPVPAAVAECYAIRQEWDVLAPLVTDTNWEYAEFLRLAFLARVQREKADKGEKVELLASRNSWNSALRAAGGRPETTLILTRYAAKWGWENETTDALWQIARGSVGQKPALKALYQIYGSKANSRGLLNVAVRTLEIDPKDPISQNNVVLFSLLLGIEMDRAQALAAESYKKQPDNPGIVSTYAYALHLRGKTDEGLALMRKLDEKFLNNPSYAAYYALLLAVGDTPAEAEKYIEIAQAGGVIPKGRLLPEEMALVKSAKEQVLRRGAAKKRDEK